MMRFSDENIYRQMQDLREGLKRGLPLDKFAEDDDIVQIAASMDFQSEQVIEFEDTGMLIHLGLN